ncbi:uncharacterized protein VTP21DRAFT_2942 [Calcarisporiella thermophila]|uniref:uncharacterized protein n=1 Tax=Calcarisporiella thermophila TaxID=911321 RepID=UPI003741F479
MSMAKWVETHLHSQLSKLPRADTFVLHTACTRSTPTRPLYSSDKTAIEDKENTWRCRESLFILGWRSPSNNKNQGEKGENEGSNLKKFGEESEKIIERTKQDEEVLISALNVYEYVFNEDGKSLPSRIIYISKVDSSGNYPYRSSISPTKALVVAYLRSLTSTCKAYSSTKVHVFARAQRQYLFAGSGENPMKRVAGDRRLAIWWLDVLAGIIPSGNETKSGTEGMHLSGVKARGWWFIPGSFSQLEAQAILRYTLATATNEADKQPFVWTYGYPYPKLARAHVAIPRFEDDPKARILQNYNAMDENEEGNENRKGGSVEEFWEVLSVGEECGAGRVTGFYVVELGHETALGERADEAASKEGNSTLSTTEHVNGELSAEVFTRVVNDFLSLDFSSQEHSIASTKRWYRISQKLGLPTPAIIRVEGSNTAQEQDVKAAYKESEKRKMEPVAVNVLGAGFIKRKKT